MNGKHVAVTGRIRLCAVGICAHPAVDTAARGRVTNGPKPGKPNPLNTGPDACDTRLLARVGADTLLGEDDLSLADADTGRPPPR